MFILIWIICFFKKLRGHWKILVLETDIPHQTGYTLECGAPLLDLRDDTDNDPCTCAELWPWRLAGVVIIGKRAIESHARNANDRLRREAGVSRIPGNDKWTRICREDIVCTSTCFTRLKRLIPLIACLIYVYLSPWPRVEVTLHHVSCALSRVICKENREIYQGK